MAVSGVRWGVLSTAKIGVGKMIPAIQAAPNCTVAAIASRGGERAREVAERLGIPAVHSSYEELLADPELDAIYLPLPNHLHAEWTIAAARAGKHVLCEKPVATSAVDAERMRATCADAGVKLMEAFMYRLHPSWVAVRERIAHGSIGELRAVHTFFSYFNDDPTNIRNIPEYGGGALLDIGCYAVNVSRMLFGSEPRRVEASVTRDAAGGVDVLTSGLLEFDGGVATFGCGTRLEPEQRVDVYGTHGRISVEIPFNIPPDRPTRIFVISGGDPPTDPHTETIEFPTANQYAIQAEQFAQAVLDDTPVPIPPEDGVANMQVIEAVFAAGEREP